MILNVLNSYFSNTMRSLLRFGQNLDMDDLLLVPKFSTINLIRFFPLFSKNFTNTSSFGFPLGIFRICRLEKMTYCNSSKITGPQAERQAEIISSGKFSNKVINESDLGFSISI